MSLNYFFCKLYGEKKTNFISFFKNVYKETY